MHLLFESDLFRLICEKQTLTYNTPATQTPPENTTTDTSTTNVANSDPETADSNLDADAEMGVDGPDTLGVDPSENKHFKSIQKYILYQNIRDVQYNLEDVMFIQKIKNKQELTSLSNFIKYVVSFFDIFTYDEAFDLSNHILTSFKKLK